MLSYILGMAYQFEREHGLTPNLLYLNHGHLEQLCAELGVSVVLEISRRLGMAVMALPDIVQPQLIHLSLPRCAAGPH